MEEEAQSSPSEDSRRSAPSAAARALGAATWRGRRGDVTEKQQLLQGPEDSGAPHRSDSGGGNGSAADGGGVGGVLEEQV